MSGGEQVLLLVPVPGEEFVEAVGGITGDVGEDIGKPGLRVSPLTVREIVERSQWPDEFLRYEQVLRIGRDSGRIAQFLNPRDQALIDTANVLRRERPDISAEDVAYVVAIPLNAAAWLLR